LLELLMPTPGEQILDIGAGPGVLAPAIARAGASYTGVDASARMLAFARRQHGRHGRFVHGDATRLASSPELHGASFDAAVFMFSIQDMDPLDAVLASAAWALRQDGRLAILMTHPCFRVPRQSGWGWDQGRKLNYRRIDRYLTPLAVPMKPYPGQRSGATRSFHRPLQIYANGLAANGFLIEALREIPALRSPPGRYAAGDIPESQEIPLLLGLRAHKSAKL
jgi:SAM-dependent methyltransferase